MASAMAAEEPRVYYLPEELGRRWRVSRRTIGREVRRGRLQGVRVGGSVRFSAEEVERYEREMVVGAEEAGEAVPLVQPSSEC